MKSLKLDTSSLISIAMQAGEEIMKIYNTGFTVEQKADKSPITEADKKANAVILEGLKKLYPDIPVISEEEKQMPYEQRKGWKRFWLIDPIDGTKEFIKRNGEFTVNIALVEDGVPVFGIVYAPAKHIIYFGMKDVGSFKCETEMHRSATDIMQSAHKILFGEHYSSKQEVILVASRSHLTTETMQFVEGLKQQGKEVTFISSGSSLKICLVADGTADVYPRFGPTMEWDTGAAHAVALYAGRNILNTETRQPLVYNKENLKNPFFIVE